MNDDALAAVVAAAYLLLAPSGPEAVAPSAGAWMVAGRFRMDDAGRARLLARSRSRWAMSGRLRG